ncbi:glycoside hydrolase family 3 N-terminal domain-containing protein [Salinigranum salinum]|uniref:glycoside hydrolase family 3 N-terminal domain-containing protein n=1 Tax=Salinigranum salinum TaxID=1364937 RepID=UPI001260EFA1|nr:glycoside hydrolase family 3 N-terminal domain-containing protein [Salinigranum salinum]
MTAAPDVDALLSRMSLDAKVAQLGTVRIGALLEDGSFSPEHAARTIPHGVGRVTRVGRESGLDPEPLSRAIADIQAFLRTETAHGIPAFVREESLCGYAGRRGATMPQAIGMASSWDPGLVCESARAVANQLRAVGCQVTLSPVADLGVEPRWGRTEETFGEDPALAARLTRAVVEGLAAGGVDATLKHFVGHGRPAGGRNRARPTASLREMRDADLVPFRVGVDAGAPSVMAAYNTVDGVPCHASEPLLTGVLREEWGFEGTVVSDGRGIEMLADDYGVTADRQAAGVLALESGVDVELPETECFGDRLVAAVREGQVAEAVVDRAVRRHLRQKIDAGVFDDAAPDEPTAATAFQTDEVRTLTRRAARRSQVLLTNDGVLPLSGTASVAVVGPNADTPRTLLGNYSYAGAENAHGGIEVVTPVDGLRGRVADCTHERGCGVRPDAPSDVGAAVAAAAAADVAVACVGGQSGIDVERDSPGTAGEALDRASLRLPGRQRELVRRVAATETPLVVVLVNGRPLAVPEVSERADALLEAWLPGQSGGDAIADVLLGADPGGRLPVSLPRSVGQLPIAYRQDAVSTGDYVFSDGSPLFPFGHGESYADVAYSAPVVDPGRVSTAGETSVSVTVTNVTDRPGTEVVQLYARAPSTSVVRPVRELVGFQRLDLAAGERATVHFDLSVETLAAHDATGRLVVEPGTVDLAVGRSATDHRATRSLVVTGDRQPVERRRPLAVTRVE